MIVLHTWVMAWIQMKARMFYQHVEEAICVLGLLVQGLLSQWQPWLWGCDNFVEIPSSSGREIINSYVHLVKFSTQFVITRKDP